MENECYVVTIISGPEDNSDDVFNPSCYPATYEEAISIARPWIDQGHEVVIAIKKCEKVEQER